MIQQLNLVTIIMFAVFIFSMFFTISTYWGVSELLEIMNSRLVENSKDYVDLQKRIIDFRNQQRQAAIGAIVNHGLYVILAFASPWAYVMYPIMVIPFPIYCVLFVTTNFPLYKPDSSSTPKVKESSSKAKNEVYAGETSTVHNSQVQSGLI
jgi:hypothetical protein